MARCLRLRGRLPLYLKKAGLASRNIVHLQKIILRCVGFCFCILYFNDKMFTSVPCCGLVVLRKFSSSSISHFFSFFCKIVCIPCCFLCPPHSVHVFCFQPGSEIYQSGSGFRRTILFLRDVVNWAVNTPKNCAQDNYRQ